VLLTRTSEDLAPALIRRSLTTRCYAKEVAITHCEVTLMGIQAINEKPRAYAAHNGCKALPSN